MKEPKWYAVLSDGIAQILFEEYFDERTGQTFFVQAPYRPGIEKELFRLLAEVFHEFKLAQLGERSLNLRVWDVAHVASAIAWILKDSEQLSEYVVGEAVHAVALAMELLRKQMEVSHEHDLQ